MADIHGDPRDAPQSPSAPGSGSAPVPYHGGAQFSEPPLYDANMTVQLVDHAADVLHPTPAGNAVTQDRGAAYGINGTPDLGIAATPDAPYYPGPLAPINAAGDRDAGGMDDV